MNYIAQLGSYTPITDTFTLLLDCNDGVNIELDEIDGLEATAPAQEVYVAMNPRIAGERVVGSRYGVRQITLRLITGPATSYSTLITSMQKLYQIQESVRVARQTQYNGLGSASRIALKIQPPGSITSVYADILAMNHELVDVGDPRAWVRLLFEGMSIELLCAPFWRAARQTLQNLINNPGAELPTSAGFLAFADPLTTLNAYQLQTGSAPTQDKSGYTDAVQADAPLRYYRMDESAGVTLNSAVSLNPATLTGGYTLGQSGALVGRFWWSEWWCQHVG
jgi:hypothetical protein